MGHGNSNRLYVTALEHSGAYGQHTAGSSGARKKTTVGQSFARLPFDCCAITLSPFEIPVCSREGTCYDLLSIMPYLGLHGTDPVTGKPLKPAELIKLHFAKNNDGKYHDPITFKVFNEHSALVAIATSGNVYLKETVDKLNVKAKNWRDLLTDEPFERKDIVTLQDPHNFELRDTNNFDYVKRGLKTTEDNSSALEQKINLSATGTNFAHVLKNVSDASATASTSKVPQAAPASKSVVIATNAPGQKAYNESTVSTGRAAASLTSTSAGISTGIENALWDEEDLMFEAIKKKGEKAYVRIVTNFGNLDAELFADKAPRTVYNFLMLALEDKYKETVFHRLIPGFMIQGGDPTGTGRGGQSYWGEPFEDEYSARNAAKHTERGTISMANSGPKTNGSQWFVTFRATPHLDNKHTVFGHLVGDQSPLKKIESVPVDATTDRPKKPVKILDVQVFKDPFSAYKEALKKRLKREEEERTSKGLKKEAKEKDRTTWFGIDLDSTSTAHLKATEGKTVGKYIGGAPGAGAKRPIEEAPIGAAAKKKKAAGGSFGDFSGW